MKRLGETGEKSEGNQKQIFSEDWRRNFNIGTKSNFRTFELKKKFKFTMKASIDVRLISMAYIVKTNINAIHMTVRIVNNKVCDIFGLSKFLIYCFC
jgi:hypothetical protein